MLAPMSALRGAEPGILVGGHLTADYVGSETTFADVPGGNLFARLFVSPQVAFDISLGYRRYESYSGDRYFLTYALRQYPVNLGASLFSSPSSFRLFIAAGASLAYSEVEATRASSHEVVQRESSFIVGAYGGLGAQIRFSPKCYVDTTVSYVWSPVSSSITNYPAGYLQGQLGIAFAF